MRLETYAEAIQELLCFSDTLNQSNLSIDCIINPVSGRLRGKVSFSRELHCISELIKEKKAAGSITQHFSFRWYLTEYSGHAGEITRHLIEEEEKEDEHHSRLIITAGGDGTASGVCQNLIASKPEVQEKITVFRLPLGTGNDGLDATTTEQAWKILLHNPKRRKLHHLSITPTGYHPLYSFNIASIGLDGYVTDLANKMKRIIPGSFYSAMVNVAALFYERSVEQKKMHLDAMYRGEQFSREEELLVVAFGVSGYRSYGGKKRILPGEENVLTVAPMNLFRKFVIKNKFYTGEHRELPEACLFSADEITIRYDGDMPFQYDGESLWFSRENFPLLMRREEPVIYVLGNS
jgi:diacylglycerol kinase family enzyme